MTAEFAAALPAALACLALCVGAVQAMGQQSRLIGAAAVEARQLGRGDPPSAAGGASGRADERAIEREGGLVCVTLSARSDAVGLGSLGIVVRARECALDESALDESALDESGGYQSGGYQSGGDAAAGGGSA